MCFVTIAAPKLTMTPGGPGRYVAPAPGEHGRPEQALLNTPFVLTPPVTPTITPPAPLLARIWAGVLRLLTGAPALTAALLLAPTNSQGDDGYKSEWDMNRLKQAPTDKDRARLDYLENEREHRTLTDEEQGELVSLLAIVRKTHLSSPTSLEAYYERRAENIALAAKLERPNDVHSINTIDSKTRFGGSNRNTAKTIGMGHVDLEADFAAIQAGDAAYDKQTQTFLTKSGRVYGYHTDKVASGGTSAIYPIRGNPGDFVNVTQAELDILRKMPDNQGLNGPARMELEGRLRAKNGGVTEDTATKLTNLFNSKKK